MKVAIVGGTGEIGRAVSRFMAARGASILAVGQTFRDFDVSGIEFIKADLSLMREAQRIGVLLPAEGLDLVILTTGIFAAPHRQQTAEGVERDMAVSYLSRLAVLREIGPRLGKHRPTTLMKPRVFIMGFPGTGQAGSEQRCCGDHARRSPSDQRCSGVNRIQSYGCPRLVAHGS
jgi:NAD(P)-dependent dehydrogenase (short-subunit alcohol dehydrogenase family)